MANKLSIEFLFAWIFGLGALLSAPPSHAAATASVLEARVLSSLRAAAWSSKAAQAFWEVNGRRLGATESVAPELITKEIGLLADLEPKGKTLNLLESYPEASGLLLLAFDKQLLSNAIIDAPESARGMLVASYLFCTSGAEVDEWSMAVQRHPCIIALLQRNCAALPYHGLFAYLTTLRLPQARELYGKWLDEVMAPAVIGQSDETLSSRLTFVASSGVELRRRLDGDSDFRRDFLAVIWPRFRDSMIHLSQAQAGKADVFYLCGLEPAIWEFFRRDDSVTLFQNVGMDAVTMLSGDGALHPDVRKVVAALWAESILDLPRAIQRYQGDSHFRALVNSLGAREDWPLLNAVNLRLAEKGSEWPQEAAYLSQLPMATLRKELHPVELSTIPGAALVSLIGKALDGRRVGGQDWMGVGFDAIDLITLGAAIPETKAAELVAKKALQQTLKAGAKEGLERLAGRTLEQIGKESANIEWTQVLAKKALEQLPQDIRQTIVKAGIVDITEPVKAGFNLSRRLGLGREPLKGLTGMEARVFMRQDGRAFINLTNIVANPSPAVFLLTRTLENVVLRSEPVEQGVRSAVPTIGQWKEDISTWWSGHATGQF